MPALSISWIDASLLAKDAMYKATRSGTKEMYFSDDGFAMGIAYCLAVLKQTRRQEALHWHDALNQKYAAEFVELQAKQSARLVLRGGHDYLYTNIRARVFREAKQQAKQSRDQGSKSQSKGFFSSLFSGSGSKPAAQAPPEPDAQDPEDEYEEFEEVGSSRVHPLSVCQHRHHYSYFVYACCLQVRTLQVSAKRLEMQRREQEQLFSALTSASVFFKRTEYET